MRKIMTLSFILLLAVAAFYFTACNNNSPGSTTTNSVNEDSIKQVIARGSYLANHVAGCIECHSGHDFTKFSSPVVAGTEGGG